MVISIWGYCDNRYTVLPRVSVRGGCQAPPTPTVTLLEGSLLSPSTPLSQNVCKHPSPSIFPSPPLELPSLGPDCFSFLLILLPILKLFSLILLTSVRLRLLLISKEIGDRPCLFLPCWGHSHLLVGSTHLSPTPSKGSGELRTPCFIQKTDQMGFSPHVRNI